MDATRSGARGLNFARDEGCFLVDGFGDFVAAVFLMEVGIGLREMVSGGLHWTSRMLGDMAANDSTRLQVRGG